jgi:hypothetical protein
MPPIPPSSPMAVVTTFFATAAILVRGQWDRRASIPLNVRPPGVHVPGLRRRSFAL